MPVLRRGQSTNEQRYSDEEATRQLDPLFGSASPNLGYFCLASLGRHRRTLVLNLNWDGMVESAARALGIPCRTLDIEDAPNEITAIWDDMDTGLLVLHIHGKLDGAIRYTQNQTLENTPRLQFTIDKILDADRLIAMGASLRVDLDVNAMLRGAKTNVTGYYFNQTDDEANLADHSTRTIDTGERFDNRQWVCDDFDFDRFMMLFVGAFRDRRYDVSRATPRWATLNMPKFADTVFPNAIVLRIALKNAFHNGVALLDGPPFVGKTVCGSILAHCIEICGPDDRCETRLFSGAEQTLGALASKLNAVSTSSLLLISPFGEERAFEENPSFLPSLSTRITTRSTRPPIIVCCERSKLDVAYTDDAVEHKPIDQIRLPGDPWFSADPLTQYAKRQERFEVVPAILKGEVNSPWEVDAWRMDTSPGRESQLADLDRLLRSHSDEALAVAIAYISKFLAPVPLNRYKDPDTLDLTVLSRFLHTYEFEGIVYARLVNSIAVSAIERYLQDKTNEISSALSSAFPSWRELRTAFDRYTKAEQMHRAAVKQDVNTWHPSLPLYVLNAATPNSAIDYILAKPSDWWSATECCYQIVLQWPTLRRSNWRCWLEKVANEDSGLYGLIEAALYYGDGTHPELWAEIETRLWQRIGPGQPMSFTLALCVDALLWRTTSSTLLHWTHTALNLIDDQSEYWGIFAFEAAYHSAGFYSLPKWFHANAAIPLSADQAAFAARMVQWHCAYQSFQRLQLSQYSFPDKAFLCRTLYREPPSNVSEVVHLVSQLGQYEATADWGFHAGCRWLDTTEPDSALTNVASRSLQTAEHNALGLITATLAYPSSMIFAEQLKERFKSEDAQVALLQTMRVGWNFNGVSVQPPRFDICSDPLRVHRAVNLKFPNLEECGLLGEWSAFLRSLDAAATALLKRDAVQPDVLDTVVSSVKSGDLSSLDAVVAARESNDSLEHALEIACLESNHPRELV